MFECFYKGVSLKSIFFIGLTISGVSSLEAVSKPKVRTVYVRNNVKCVPSSCEIVEPRVATIGFHSLIPWRIFAIGTCEHECNKGGATMSVWSHVKNKLIEEDSVSIKDPVKNSEKAVAALLRLIGVGVRLSWKATRLKPICFKIGPNGVKTYRVRCPRTAKEWKNFDEVGTWKAKNADNKEKRPKRSKKREEQVKKLEEAWEKMSDDGYAE